MEIINILGLDINIFTKQQALAKIEEFLAGQGQYHIVTLNPEIILTAIKPDEEFFYILNRADLSLPDGIGLKIAAWLEGINLVRITGADLTKDILELAKMRGRRVAIFNRQDGLSSQEDIKRALNNKYPGLSVIVIGLDRQAVIPKEKLAAIKEFNPEIIFSTFGAPDQEKFIFHNLARLPSVKIGLGVGGAFDFLTGRIKRAPKIFRIVGLEWLWRLIKQPARWKRIYNAVIVFPAKFFLWRFVLPRFYRSNVACLLYKKESRVGGQVSYKILIVSRANEKNHWQLPQGGTDGENLMVAGRRELSEEINTDKFKFVAAFPKLHVYEFGEEMFRLGAKSAEIWGYRGQKQGLFIAEFFGADADIKVNFWEHNDWCWVDSAELVNQVHLVRRPATKIFMEKFNKTVNLN